MTRQKALYKFTKFLVDFMYYCGIVIIILVPFLLKKFSYLSEELSSDSIRLQTSVVLIISGVLAVFILDEIRNIFNTIVKDENPFKLSNVKSLRKMAVCAFLIGVLFTYKCFFWFTLATAIIILVFAVAGLFCLVLADVFKQAVYYKEENDLTV